MSEEGSTSQQNLEEALNRIKQLEAARTEDARTIAALQAPEANATEASRINLLEMKVQELVEAARKHPTENKQSELQKLVITKVPTFNCERSVEAVTSFRRDFRRAVTALGMEDDQNGQMILFLAKLGENAQKWKEVREKDATQKQLGTVEDWLEEILKVFYPREDADRAREEFSLLKQKSGEKVDEFVTRLNTLLLRLPPKSDEDVAVAFVNGLTEPAASIVGIQRMTELAKGGSLTFAQLAQIAGQVKQGQGGGHLHVNQIYGEKSGFKRKRQTGFPEWSAEQQERYRLQQCFHCGSIGHKRSECPVRTSQNSGKSKEKEMSFTE